MLSHFNIFIRLKISEMYSVDNDKYLNKKHFKTAKTEKYISTKHTKSHGFR